MSSSSDYRTVAEALHYLEAHHLHQPSLEELAANAGMSKYHFQRLFTRWAGVSPKRFLQFLTLEHAKELLRESEPLLKTALASGLSGPARLHDLFITAEGVTPGEFKTGGLSLQIIFGFHSTPFGLALFARTERGLCHLAFLDSDDLATKREALDALRADWPGASLEDGPKEASKLAQAIFFSGNASGPRPPLSLFLKGTNYQIRVWTALMRIPVGSVTTYGKLAGALGAPKSGRAVGSAVARNPVAYLIPCHRVIRAVGAFGEYRWGSVRKKAILAWEAARRSS
jgi:AraC family transcriptional regulator of adaptative response/methylated-DNA-[protein]-cysteine methyltransferase